MQVKTVQIKEGLSPVQRSRQVHSEGFLGPAQSANFDQLSTYQCSLSIATTVVPMILRL